MLFTTFLRCENPDFLPAFLREVLTSEPPPAAASAGRAPTNAAAAASKFPARSRCSFVCSSAVRFQRRSNRKRPAPCPARCQLQSDACTHVGAALGLAILFEWTYVENNYLKPFDRKIDPDQNHTGSGDGADLVVEEAAGYSVGEEANHIVSCCIATVHCPQRSYQASATSCMRRQSCARDAGSTRCPGSRRKGESRSQNHRIRAICP